MLRSYARPRDYSASASRMSWRLSKGSNATPVRGEVLGEPGAGEHPLRGKRGAPVGDAVADVHVWHQAGERDPLARLAAHLAVLPLEERRAPARRVGLDAVRDDRGRHALAGEDRLDQLMEPGRDDQRIVGGDELGQTRPHSDGVEQPVEHRVERRRDRRHLDADHLVERQFAPDLRLERMEHIDVAELLDRHVERVALGDRAVPVEDEPRQGADMPACRCRRPRGARPRRRRRGRRPPARRSRRRGEDSSGGRRAPAPRPRRTRPVHQRRFARPRSAGRRARPWRSRRVSRPQARARSRSPTASRRAPRRGRATRPSPSCRRSRHRHRSRWRSAPAPTGACPRPRRSSRRRRSSWRTGTRCRRRRSAPSAGTAPARAG